MKNDKEDYSDKPISQSGFPDRHRAQPAPEGSGQTSPADIARSGDIFTGLVSGVPKAYEAIEHKLLGEKSPEELAAKRDIFMGLMGKNRTNTAAGKRTPAVRQSKASPPRRHN